ncbi:MAG: hypothetical protein ABSC61_10045 [Anaerolineales bacterium]
MDINTTLILFISLILGFVMAIIIEYFRTKTLLKKKAIRDELLHKAVNKEQLEIINEALSTIKGIKNEERNSVLRIWGYVSAEENKTKDDWPLNLITQQIEEDNRLQVEKYLQPLKNRLEEIESRFPKKSTIEKLALVNDAILATKIETLTEEIGKLDKRILNKWDVALIVFEVILAVIAIGTLIFTALQYLATKAAL